MRLNISIELLELSTLLLQDVDVPSSIAAEALYSHHPFLDPVLEASNIPVESSQVVECLTKLGHAGVGMFDEALITHPQLGDALLEVISFLPAKPFSLALQELEHILGTLTDWTFFADDIIPQGL